MKLRLKHLTEINETTDKALIETNKRNWL